MHYQFLIEDQSSAALIEILMRKIVNSYPTVTYDCKSFKGLGGITPKNTVKETKTGKLLNDLATYLRGFDKSLQCIPAVIIATLIGFSRLYLFVHFPTDVLGGFAIAILVAIGVDWAFRQFAIWRAKKA